MDENKRKLALAESLYETNDQYFLQSDEHHPEDIVWDDLDELDAQNKDQTFQTQMAETEFDLQALNELLA